MENEGVTEGDCNNCDALEGYSLLAWDLPECRADTYHDTSIPHQVSIRQLLKTTHVPVQRKGLNND